MMSWYKPAGTLATADAEISLTPKDAGWEFCGFYTYNFAKNAEVKVELTGKQIQSETAANTPVRPFSVKDCPSTSTFTS